MARTRGRRARRDAHARPTARSSTASRRSRRVTGDLLEHVARERTVGVLLVRLGGYAAGVFRGRAAGRLEGRQSAGARAPSRGRVEREPVRAAARGAGAGGAAGGGGRRGAGAGGPAGRASSTRSCSAATGARSATVLEDPRLAAVRALAVERVLEVGDPRLKVLEATPDAFRATIVRGRAERAGVSARTPTWPTACAGRRSRSSPRSRCSPRSRRSATQPTLPTHADDSGAADHARAHRAPPTPTRRRSPRPPRLPITAGRARHRRAADHARAAGHGRAPDDAHACPTHRKPTVRGIRRRVNVGNTRAGAASRRAWTRDIPDVQAAPRVRILARVASPPRRHGSPDLTLPSLDVRLVARRAALPLALAAAAAAVVLLAGGPLGTSSPTRSPARCRPTRAGSPLAAVAELLSFGGYIALFWLVGHRATPRLDLRASAEITLGGAAATRLLPTAGVGGAALTLWAIAKTGIGTRRAGRTLLTFLSLLYGAFLAGIALSGAAIALGLGGDAGHALVAGVASLAAAAAIVAAVVPRPAPRRRRATAPAASRAAPRCSARRSATRSARSARGDARLLGAPAWWVFDAAVLWATFQALGEPPALAVLAFAYFAGQVGNTIPIPGAVSGGMVGTLLALRRRARPRALRGARLPRRRDLAAPPRSASPRSARCAPASPAGAATTTRPPSSSRSSSPGGALPRRGVRARSCRAPARVRPDAGTGTPGPDGHPTDVELAGGAPPGHRGQRGRARAAMRASPPSSASTSTASSSRSPRPWPTRSSTPTAAPSSTVELAAAASPCELRGRDPRPGRGRAGARGRRGSDRDHPAARAARRDRRTAAA